MTVCYVQGHLGLQCGGRGAEDASVIIFQESAEALANVDRSRAVQNSKVIIMQDIRAVIYTSCFHTVTTLWQETGEYEAHEQKYPQQLIQYYLYFLKIIMHVCLGL